MTVESNGVNSIGIVKATNVNLAVTDPIDLMKLAIGLDLDQT